MSAPRLGLSDAVALVLQRYHAWIGDPNVQGGYRRMTLAAGPRHRPKRRPRRALARASMEAS